MGALRANLEQAKVQKSIEIATYEKAIQTAFREVSDGLAGQRTFDDQIKAEQSREAASGAAYKLSEQRFKEGEDSNLALLDAQRAHYGSQQALVRARLDETMPSRGLEKRADFVERLRGAVSWVNRNRAEYMWYLSTNQKERAADCLSSDPPGGRTKW